MLCGIHSARSHSACASAPTVIFYFYLCDRSQWRANERWLCCALCTCGRWNAQIGDSEWKDGMGGGGWLVAGPLYCIADTRLRGIMQSKHKRSEHQSNNQKEKAFFKAEKFYNSSGTTGSIFYNIAFTYLLSFLLTVHT